MLQRIRFALPLFYGLILSLPHPLRAQQNAAPSLGAPANSTLTIHSDTNMVNLPIVVRDKHGELVKNISKEDLTLTEDGKPQPIRYFDRDVNLPLTLGLLVDVSYSQRDALDDERAASKTFLNEMLGAQDKAFVIEFAREVDLLADPTGIRATLQAALEHLAIMSSASNSDDSSSGSDSSHGHGYGGGTQLYDAIFLASDEVIKKQPNRKALIVLTDGVDRGSKESLVSVIETAQRADTMVYAIYFSGSEEHHDHSFGNNGGGTPGGGHGGGGGGWPGSGGGWPGGGRPGGGRPGGGGNRPHDEEPRVDGRKILERITQETGGALFAVSKKETVDSIYQQIADELRNQFRLGYTPPTHDGPGFHDVSVIAKDKKLTVQTRAGYYSDK